MNILMIYVLYLVLIVLCYAQWFTFVKFGVIYLTKHHLKQLHTGWHLFAIVMGLWVYPAKIVYNYFEGFVGVGFLTFICTLIYVNILQ